MNFLYNDDDDHLRTMSDPGAMPAKAADWRGQSYINLIFHSHVNTVIRKYL